MRLIALFIALVSFVVTGCDKSDEEPDFAASYSGTFTRMDPSPAYSPVVSNVTIDFTDKTFAGSSDSRSYPAICNGSFSITQSKITVVNSCFFTADFDWSLIFKGDYNYELIGKELRIWRDYPNGQKDIYTLTKKP